MKYLFIFFTFLLISNAALSQKINLGKLTNYIASKIEIVEYDLQVNGFVLDKRQDFDTAINHGNRESVLYWSYKNADSTFQIVLHVNYTYEIISSVSYTYHNKAEYINFLKELPANGYRIKGPAIYLNDFINMEFVGKKYNILLSADKVPNKYYTTMICSNCSY